MITIKYKITTSEIHGVGLFTEQKILKGEVIYKPSTLLDVNISVDEFESLNEKEKKEVSYYGYLHKPSGKWHVAFDAIRMINHSKSPNVFQGDDMILYAKRDIKKGEELLQSYLDFDLPEELSQRW